MIFRENIFKWSFLISQLYLFELLTYAFIFLRFIPLFPFFIIDYFYYCLPKDFSSFCFVVSKIFPCIAGNHVLSDTNLFELLTRSWFVLFFIFRLQCNLCLNFNNCFPNYFSYNLVFFCAERFPTVLVLFRVEILENQLSTYGKSMGEERLREEAKRLMEEKESYQIAAKETLKKLVDDKVGTGSVSTDLQSTDQA